MRRIAIALLTALSTTLAATDCVSVYGQALFLKACIDNPYYTILGPFNLVNLEPVGTQIANDIPFRVGFRVGGTYTLPDPCYRVGVRWTTLNTHDFDSSSVAGPTRVLWITLGPTDLSSSDGDLFNAIATSRFDFHYDALDGDINRCFGMGCVVFNVLGGVRYASVQYRHTVLYDGSTSPTVDNNYQLSLLDKSRTWGVGPRIGVGGKLCIGCGLSATADWSYSLLAGENHASSFALRDFQNTLRDLDVPNQDICQVFSINDFRIGAEFCTSVCAPIRLGVTGGFEMIFCSRVIHVNEFLNAPADGRNIQRLSSFDLFGFYVGLMAGF